MNFSFSQINPGLYLIQKEFTAAKGGFGSDISGPYWMLIESEILAGADWWVSNGREVRPQSSHYFIFLPPFSWTMEHYQKGTSVKIRGLISRAELAAQPFAEPVLFTSPQPLPQSLSEIPAFLRSAKNVQTISANSAPSALSKRAKQMMDQGAVEVQEIARKLKTSAAVLSRRFKADFGQSPAFYRKGLRVTVGMYELMMGRPPAEAAALAGYSDLGRFYKQFKAYLKQTPAEYLEKSRNAKKSRGL